MSSLCLICMSSHGISSHERETESCSHGQNVISICVEDMRIGAWLESTWPSIQFERHVRRPQIGELFVVDNIIAFKGGRRGHPFNFRCDFAKTTKACFQQDALLLKAFQSVSKTEPIYDVTGGLLHDATLLVASGFQVHAFEHNPYIYILADNGRLRAGDQLSALSYYCEDAQQSKRLKDAKIIYFDPMFTAASHTQKPSKKAQVLRHFAASDTEVKLHSQLAYFLSLPQVCRVVVKRGSSEPVLGTPTSVIEGTSIRYEMHIR